MALVLHFVLTCAAFLVCFANTKGHEFQEDLLTINVDKSNHSSHSTIQAAIDSVASNNNKWICISIKAGNYNELVKIPKDKPFIHLKGEGIGKTNVVWSGHDTMLRSATFTSMADHILVSGITFVNSYNYPPSKKANPVKPAVAAKISGDKSAFYKCSFLGFQDTLLDDMGRHYFKFCTIEGAIDFIFGNGQSIYEKCNIRLNIGIPNPDSTGYIAAQARANPDDGSGFVFKKCKVFGIGKAYLGRAWKPHSRVIYYNSFLSNMIVPQGWDSWDYDGHEKNIMFSEEQCQGSGSNKSNRVKWEKTLCPEELHMFSAISYIDSEGWIRKLPRQLGLII